MNLPGKMEIHIGRCHYKGMIPDRVLNKFPKVKEKILSKEKEILAREKETKKALEADAKRRATLRVERKKKIQAARKAELEKRLKAKAEKSGTPQAPAPKPEEIKNDKSSGTGRK